MRNSILAIHKMCVTLYQQNSKTMTHSINTADKAFKNQRDAMLALMEVESDSNVYTYALRLMYSLKHNFVTSSQYEMLCTDLKEYCKENNLSTSGQGVSLF